MGNSYIELDKDVYEIIPSEAVAGSRIIQDMYEKLGRPQDPFSKAGKKMMEIIIAIWQDLWPQEAAQWLADRDEYKKNELSLTEQVRKGTGRQLASYPGPVFHLMKLVFPKLRLGDRQTVMKLVKHYPIFQMANKV